MRMKSYCERGALLIALMLGTFFPLSYTHAEGEDADRLSELVVTAQRREQSMQDVGTSITALSGADISKLGLLDTKDIASQTPGLQFNSYEPTITVFNIRGVSQNDFGDHQEAPVAVYADDVYLASMGAISGALFDIARVEVLRGPQGTLFGRNATGGLVHYVSEKPAFDDSGYVQLTYSRFQTVETQGAANFKINDTNALRFSFAANLSDGYLRNTLGPTADNQNNYSARVQYRSQPTDGGEITLKLYTTQNINERVNPYSWLAAKPNAQGLGEPLAGNDPYWGVCPGCDFTGYKNPGANVYDQNISRTGVFNRSIYGMTAHVDWKFSDVSVASVTDFQHMDKRYNDPTEPSPTPVFLFYLTDQQYTQFSQELHVSGHAQNLRWIAGLYFLDIQTHHEIQTLLDPSIGGNYGDHYNMNTQSIAGFAQLEYDIGSRFTAILGGRETHDHKTDDYTIYAGTPGVGTIPGYPYNSATNPSANRKWNLPTWKAELDFKLAERSLLYASVNRGAKSGGWAAPALPAPPSVLAFNPEKLTSYEAGLKTELFGGHVRFNSSLFYYDYRDYQLFLQQGLVQSVGNRNARVKGGEAELTYVPAKGWNFGVGVSGLSSVVKNVTLPDGEVADRVLPQAPKWSVNGHARYEWSMFAGTLSAQADIKWDDSSYFSAFNAPVDLEARHAITNARLGYASGSGNWDVAAFLQNVFNRQYRVYDLDLSSIGFATPVYGPPRWWGITGAYHWR
jgi:iron complex outermembrane receptor protein